MLKKRKAFKRRRKLFTKRILTPYNLSEYHIINIFMRLYMTRVLFLSLSSLWDRAPRDQHKSYLVRWILSYLEQI